ncbi:putative late blight resistance protein homolog R1B-13 [Lycium barbarum]|uniref:putative late blight resistance protein homolog R1B-13 n=1 Tax=Lycium barbarum TaxID=112863 RepID=UPI00293EC731|nr:putative late blight resistance protein homolog R1B-13 [Lycium barbarum]
MSLSTSSSLFLLRSLPTFVCEEGRIASDLRPRTPVHCTQKRADNIGRIAGRTPNLKKLRCIFADSGCWGENENRFPVLDSLSQLETLNAVFTSIPKIGPSRLNFPMNLKKLTLCKFRLPLDEISIIDNLFKLEVLKLQQVAFKMDEWEVRDNEFPQLKFLELENLKLSKWIVSDKAFSFLERLVLDRCLHLEGIPNCFEDLGYLQYNEDVADSAKHIEETRVGNGHKCDMKGQS